MPHALHSARAPSAPLACHAVIIPASGPFVRAIAMHERSSFRANLIHWFTHVPHASLAFREGWEKADCSFPMALACARRRQGLGEDCGFGSMSGTARVGDWTLGSGDRGAGRRLRDRTGAGARLDRREPGGPGTRAGQWHRTRGNRR